MANKPKERSYVTKKFLKKYTKKIAEKINSIFLKKSDISLKTLESAKKYTDNAINFIIPNTVVTHNNFPRMDVLTDRYDLSEILTMTAKRDYHDIFSGDKIIVPVPAIPETGFAGGNVAFFIGEIESHHNYGDTPILNNRGHLLCFPETTLGFAKMNATNTTDGGYDGSDMNNIIMPAIQAALESAFGAEHLLTAREWLTSVVDPNAISKGIPSQKGSVIYASNWVNKKCRLMSELEVYGSSCFSSSGYDDMGGLSHQIALFRNNPATLCIRENYWLSSVCDFKYFCVLNSKGIVNFGSADGSFGVRPRFIIG